MVAVASGTCEEQLVLLNAELVAFGILHNNPILTALGDGLDFRPPEVDEHVDVAIHCIDTVRVFNVVAATGVDVQVNPVLCGLGLGYPLEEHPRTDPIRVNQRTRIVPVLFWDSHRRCPSLPAVVFRRWRLQHVAKHSRPEGCQACRIGGVNRDLKLCSHEQSLPAGHIYWLGRHWCVPTQQQTTHHRGYQDNEATDNKHAAGADGDRQ